MAVKYENVPSRDKVTLSKDKNMRLRGNKASSVNKVIMCAAVLTLLSARSPAFATNMIQPYKLVSAPTAEILPRAFIDIEMNIYASRGGYGSGLIAGVHMGLTDRLMLGLSYGGEGLIGSGSVYWNRYRDVIYPGVLVKYRIIEESTALPAFTIGFDNQGYGGPATAGQYGYDGYIFKAPGFFVACSKSFMMMNKLQLGFHGTLNHAIEGSDDMSWGNYLNAMMGVDIALNEELAIIAEYDFAWNDVTGPRNDYFHLFRGFLNLGVRWAFTPNFHLQFDFRDILENKTIRAPIPGDPDRRVPIGWSREMKVIYITKF
jgi:hypothetical protein